MKKWLLLPLILLLLLAGCSEETPQTDGTTVPQGTEGMLMPEHPLTESTGGAVEAFVPEGNGFHTAIPFGEDLLLVREWELVLLEGTERKPALTRPQKYDKLFVMRDGVACWIREEGHILFLNDRLREVSRLQMPEDFTGEPFLTEDEKLLYYSTGSQIRALELETGVSRPVYRSPEKQVTLKALLWDGGVLRCTERAGAKSRTVILSAQTGEVLASGDDYASLLADGGGFYVELTDEALPQKVFGTGDGNPGTVQGIDPDGLWYPVPEWDLLLVVYEKEAGVQLDRYDLVSGKRTASVMLDGVSRLWDLRVEEDGKIRFFCDGKDQPLCWWDPARSAIEDDTVYTAPYYTAENPDTEGLAAVEAKAKELADRFGIRILIGMNGPEGLPEDYSFVPEYMVPVYEAYLPALEQALSRFPEGFFTKAMETRGGVLRLYLLRQVLGVPEKGTLDREQGMQLWIEKDALIVLPLTENLEQDLYHMLMHVAESRIFAIASVFDRWNSLNPKDFAYDNDYKANLNRDDKQYLTGDNRYFIDAFSMSFAKEDRARIFEYACMPGNEDLFRTNAMQTKLKRICEGIRTAFGLKKYQGELVWEQYLQQ